MGGDQVEIVDQGIERRAAPDHLLRAQLGTGNVHGFEQLDEVEQLAVVVVNGQHFHIHVLAPGRRQVHVQHALPVAAAAGLGQGAAFACLVAGNAVAVGYLEAVRIAVRGDGAEAVAIGIIGREYPVVGIDQNGWTVVALQHVGQTLIGVAGDDL